MLRINDARLPRDRLPMLISDSLETLLGKHYRVLDPAPPWAESAIFALDSKNRPVLVQYDADDGGRALLTGLATLDKLARDIHWLTRSYPEFSKGRPLVQPDLVTVSPTPPAGTSRLCRGSTWLRCFTFRPLRVNDEIGLLLEPVGVDAPLRAGRAAGASKGEPSNEALHADASAMDTSAAVDTPHPLPVSGIEASMSEEEEEFFQHL